MKLSKTITSFFALTLMIGTFVFGAGNEVLAKKGSDTSHMKATKVKHIYFDEKEHAYFDERSDGYIGEVYTIKGGKVVGELTPEEYIDLLEQQEEKEAQAQKKDKDKKLKIENGSAPLAGTSFWYYDEDSNDDAIFYGERASIIQQNEGPESDEFEISYSYTEGYEISGSGSIGSAAKTAIQAGVGFTWVSSATISSAHTMTIPAGYEGYWRFDPRKNISYGELYVVDSASGYMTLMDDNVRAYSPAKINGKLDGNLVAVKKKMSGDN